MPKLNLEKYFDTSKVTNMNGMFGPTGYTSMTTLNLGDKFDTSNVTIMAGMFDGTGDISMTTLNFGTFVVNHLENIKLSIYASCPSCEPIKIHYGLFSNGGYYSLQEIIVKNESVKEWLIDQKTQLIKEVFMPMEGYWTMPPSNNSNSSM